MIALIVSITSLVISVFFAVKAMQSSKKSNDLSESQKTAALISILAPACKSPEEWKLFINYLSKNNRLPNFSNEDMEFLSKILNRLEIKGTIVNGRLKTER
ncbi:MAG: hypothetical protein AAF558_00575 [Verrucomicrobiota bacterium]